MKKPEERGEYDYADEDRGNKRDLGTETEGLDEHLLDPIHTGAFFFFAFRHTLPFSGTAAPRSAPNAPRETAVSQIVLSSDGIRQDPSFFTIHTAQSRHF